MKFKNKVVAAVSATVMAAGMVMSSVPAFASSEEMDFINSYNGTARELAQYVINEGCTIDESKHIMDNYLKGKAEIEEKNNGISTYSVDNEVLPEYYSSIKFASSKHYIAAISLKPNITIRKVNLFFGANTDYVFAPLEGSYRACFSYSSMLSDINTSLNYPSNDKWEYEISISDMKSLDKTEAQVVVIFPLGKNTKPLSEADLYKDITFDYNTTMGRGMFTFETFAMGDVNHDGEISDADYTLLAECMMGKNDLSLQYADGSNHYSGATNLVAADVNQDNAISLSDLMLIDKYLNGSYEM